MALLPVQASVGTTGTGTVRPTVFPSTVTSGNGVVVLVSYGANTLTSITDTEGNAYLLAGVGSFFGADLAAIYYCANVTGGPVFTATAHFSSSTPAEIIAFEVPGNLTLQAANASAGNSVNPAPGAVNTGVVNTLVFVVLNKTGSVITPPAGFTEARNTGTSDAAYNPYATVQVGLDPPWSTTAGTPWAAAIAAFSSTAGVGPATGLVFGNLTFSGSFTFEPVLGNLLRWTAFFVTGAPIVANASWSDTLTWSVSAINDLNLKDFILWTGAKFGLAESYDRLTDTLSWAGRFEPDVNLLAAGRYRR
jgi:hypothetical protein